ncbi:ABC transporter ATP-binding protein [Micromonospora maritima]|uniref:ABC transporter ATP-binding protein n=1 Tax=Micromonospora maritima TaxID=986711 RepID=UPI001FEAF1F2|nr:ABC transporter ATP-binding protein [Micromonospora maritima]
MRTSLAAVRLAWRAAPAFVLCYGCVVLGQAATPVSAAWLMKTLIDQLDPRLGAGDRTVPVAVALTVVGVLAALLPQLERFLGEHIGRATGLLAQDRLYAALDTFSGLGRFEDPGFQDRLRLAQQAAGVTSTQLVSDLFGIVAKMLTLAGFVTALCLISPLMVGFVVAAVVPVMLAELAMARQRAALAWGLSPVERRELFFSGLLSSLEAATEIRLFNIGPFLRRRMIGERTTANRARSAQERRELRTQALLAVLAAAVSGGGLLWAVARARAGVFSVGDLTLFVTSVGGVQAALSALVLVIARSNQQLMLFRHYQDIIEAEPDLPVPPRPAPITALRRGIELRDVWFRYADDHPWVLRGVSLFIPQGAVLGLVGRNGAGKSTLVKLLCRFYDPTRGEILWDGVDLRRHDPRALRERISALFQDFMHYDLSAAENVAVGDIQRLDDRGAIEEASRVAGSHATLAALPRGYDTLLTRMFRTFGEDDDDAQSGVLLSGGQWQRIALARAMFRGRRDLMILDEPSAGLDAVAEHEVNDLVKRHRAGATAVLISHRMSSLRDADVLAVLRDGRIAEVGSHDELIDSGGDYAALFETQASGYSDVQRSLS